ncbi:MAG: DNA polymerase [Thermofilaceae archaeon]|nr:DNA polymerase [Thermofilaceae archaeon]
MNYACIARVDVNVPENIDPPPFPFRDKKTGKLIFPTGKFETVLATPELREGWKYIEKVKELVVYETKKVFEKYVDYFYKKRIEAKQQNDKVHDLLYKLLLNSLYGKFAEVKVEGEKYFFCPQEKRSRVLLSKRGYKIIITPPLGKIIYGEKREKTRFTAVSAVITSYARVKLLKTMEKAGIENVVYCDTDSLFLINPVVVKEKLGEELDGSTLGKLKIESIEKKVTIVLPKVYKTDSKIKIKGVPKRAAQELTKKYRFERVVGPLEQLKRKIPWGIIWETDEKKIEARYDKRIVLPDNTTKPLVFGTMEKFIY